MCNDVFSTSWNVQKEKCNVVLCPKEFKNWRTTFDDKFLDFYVSAYSDSEAITNPDDLLPPIEKLQKYAESDNIFNR